MSLRIAQYRCEAYKVMVDFHCARKFERFLEALEPQRNPGFFRQCLDLAIRKS
jgi:hypothetical protein